MNDSNPISDRKIRAFLLLLAIAAGLASLSLGDCACTDNAGNSM